MSFNRVKPSNYPSGGEVAHTEMNQLDIDHANALDKVGGDTITGPIVVTGTSIDIDDTSELFVDGELFIRSGGNFQVASGVTYSVATDAQFISTMEVGGLATLTGGASVGTHNLAITSRSVTRVMNGYVQDDKWDAIAPPAWGASAAAQAAPGTYLLQFELKVPNGAVLTSVTVRLTGASLHSTAPLTLPRLTVYSLDTSGNQVSLGALTDTSAAPGGSPAGYDVTHSITVSGLSVTIDRTTKRYIASVSPEAGTGAQIGSPQVYTCAATWTQTAYEED
jgi:hypothetical protein